MQLEKARDYGAEDLGLEMNYLWAKNLINTETNLKIAKEILKEIAEAICKVITRKKSQENIQRYTTEI